MVKTRFSPSPTGYLHLGNARAALFSALYARKEQGIFLLRIEDTDVSRSDEKYIESLQHDLQWLGLDWQEGPLVDGPNGPYWQSHRQKIYDQYYTTLEKQGHAYPCFCSEQELALNRKLQLSRGQAPRYPGTCFALDKAEIAKRLAEGKKPALRFHTTSHTLIEFTDLVKGLQRFSSDDIGDFIIRRADGTSSFLFCNAIDDSLMGVTHVIRGEDHLTNTPRQIMILQALGLRRAEYGHLSLITGDDGTPLSKRHGSYSLQDLHAQGFLPLAICNYLGRLSHTYTSNHLLKFAELAEQFELNKISRASARFDLNQLLHWQKEAVMLLTDQAVWEWLGQAVQNQIPTVAKELFVAVVKNNCLLPKEAASLATLFFSDDFILSEENKAILLAAGKNFFFELQKAIELHGIESIAILNHVKTVCQVNGKQLFMPVRVALTMQQHGPELAQVFYLLGKERMLSRLSRVLSEFL